MRRFDSTFEHSILLLPAHFLRRESQRPPRRLTPNAKSCVADSIVHVHSTTLAMDAGRAPAVLFSGPLAAGKWTREEEQYTLQLIVNFMEGRCPDCEKGKPSPFDWRCTQYKITGTTLLIYLASQLNTPTNRIINKFVEKPKLLDVSIS